MSGEKNVKQINKSDVFLNRLTESLDDLKENIKSSLKPALAKLLSKDQLSLIPVQLSQLYQFGGEFEKLQQAILVILVALRCNQTAGGQGDYNEAMYTVTNIFKEAVLGADDLFLTFIQGKISSVSGQLRERAEQIMSASGVSETIPTPFDICFGNYSDILNEMNQFLEEYEEFFTEDRFAGYLEKFDRSSTTHENRVMECKKLNPLLDSFIVKLTALSDRMIGYSQLFAIGDEDLLKSLNLITGESVGDASALAAALKALPVLRRVMKADDTIENFMAKAPEASGPWGKFNISQLHEIDTRLTVLETRLCLLVVIYIINI